MINDNTKAISYSCITEIHESNRRLGQSIKREGENDREMIEEEHLEMVDVKKVTY